MANGSCMITFSLCSAAAVASDLMLDATNTPCCQLKASYTRGIPFGRRPPKINALIGTPAGSFQAGSMTGHWEIGAQNREFGCAAGLPESLVQFSFPSQSVMVTFGGISFSRPVKMK